MRRKVITPSDKPLSDVKLAELAREHAAIDRMRGQGPCCRWGNEVYDDEYARVYGTVKP